jgi:cyclohexanone monooxygenase
MFMIAGPQGPTPFANNVVCIEENVEFAADAIRYVFDRGLSVFEPSAKAQQRWCELVDGIAETTLIPKARTTTWFMGTNIPGRPRASLAFLGGFPMYRQMCAQIVANDYCGFCLA